MDELQNIRGILSLRTCTVPPSGTMKYLIDAGSRHTSSMPPFLTRQDRSTHIRFRTCRKRYPELVSKLMRKVESRPDYQVCEQACHQISCDSSIEALHLLVLLASGAEPLMVRPLEFGQPPHPICDPQLMNQVGHRLHPCLKLNEAFHFFQVSFQADSVLRVDVLRWDDKWSVLEINGLGHDYRKDHDRAARLRLPVHWFSEEDIIAQAKATIYRRIERCAS
jgi:hypothetical protein